MVKYIQPNYKKIEDIVRLYEELGDKFPKFAIFIVVYNAFNSLWSTLERIPKELIEVKKYRV